MLVGVLAWAGATGARAEPHEPIDLGTIRYRDPQARREVWVGVDGGGIAIPRSVSPLGRRLWLANVTPAWAFALTRRVAVGGRHGITLYDAENIRLRVHGHFGELSAKLLDPHPKRRDRVSVGFEVHDVERSIVDGVVFKLGGIRDVVFHFGYGIEHRLARWLWLGWRAQMRQVWVFVDTQRHLRGSVRAAFVPHVQHRIALELVGFWVNRDKDQAGTPVPEHSAHGQVVGEYAWMSRHHVGLVIGGRYATSFLSGEAPIYEIREESLNAAYGEVTAGLRFTWP